MTKSVWTPVLAFNAWMWKKNSYMYSQLTGSLSPDYKYPHMSAFPRKPYLTV